MANEKRLIDVRDLIEWIDNFDRENTLRILRGKKAKLLNSHAIKNMIVTVPRVDAVEVVRCKDCKWGTTPYGDEHDGWTECTNIHGRPLFRDDGFCSYGEKRGDGNA